MITVIGGCAECAQKFQSLGMALFGTAKGTRWSCAVCGALWEKQDDALGGEWETVGEVEPA